MPNQIHLESLKKGAHAWNTWRIANSISHPDLADADLTGMNLHGFNLAGANLQRAVLCKTNLSGIETKLQSANLDNAQFNGADLSGAEMQWSSLRYANLSGEDTRLVNTSMMNAYLHHTDFSNANLSKVKINDAWACYATFNGCNLQNARLWGSDFREAKFIGADLRRANLMCANFVMAKFDKAVLTGANVYGASIWDVSLEGAEQKDIIVTHPNYSPVMTDNMEVAQFIHLLLTNHKIRNVIDTVSKKAVLILGRFGERMAILNAIRDELRRLGYVPIIFDFERPVQRDFDETIKVLAGLCLFVIADITKPKSCPFELHCLVPDYMIPFMAIQEKEEGPFAMFIDLQHKHSWVSALLKYKSLEGLIANLSEKIVEPALQKHQELVKLKSSPLLEEDID